MTLPSEGIANDGHDYLNSGQAPYNVVTNARQAWYRVIYSHESESMRRAILRMSADQLFSTLLGSETRGELLILFHRNPGLIDTMEGVARRIGRTAPQIDGDVKALVELGVLVQKMIGGVIVIRLDRQKDKQVLESVASHIRSVSVGGEK